MKKTLIKFLVTFFVGLLFSIGGLSAIFFLTSTTKMSCERLPDNEGYCTITTEKMLSKHTQTIKTKDLFKASVNRLGELRKTTFNIVLDTAKGEVDFLPSYINQNEGLYEITDNINNFIDLKESKTLTVKKEQQLIAYVFGGAFIIFGLMLIAISLVLILADTSSNPGNLDNQRR